MYDSSFNLNSFLSDLEKIVNIDSGTKDIEGITKVADFLYEEYSKIGCSVKKHRFNEDVGPCLEVTNTDKEKYDVLLIGHIDTVFPHGTAAKRPFTIKGNRAYGPGVADMKSGDLLALYVMKEIMSEYKNMPSICIAHNSDEETGSKASFEWIVKLAKKSRYVFVLEPARPGGELVNKRKGLAGYTLNIKGVASHAGVAHHKGRSAIQELAHWIIEMHNLTNYDAGTTLNVGTVNGGTAGNVVAEKAEAKIDLRVESMKECYKVEAKMKELVNHPRTKDVKSHILKRGMRPPMNPSIETKNLEKKVEEIGENLGIEIKWMSTGGGSDANYTAAAGIPSLDGFGPIGGATHSKDEYLEIGSIEKRKELLKKVILEVSKI